jgi:hypothetical protein
MSIAVTNDRLKRRIVEHFGQRNDDDASMYSMMMASYGITGDGG